MTISFIVDAKDLGGVANMLAAAGTRAPVALARALNRAGKPASTAYKRQVRKVLGLKAYRYGGSTPTDILNRKTSIRTANPGNLEYSLVGFGKGLPAKFYDPKETVRGAEINWLGSRKVIARSFYLAGKFPRRVTSKLTKAGVFQRKGAGRMNFKLVDGPGVPEAMVTPQMNREWLSQVQNRLPKEISHQLYAILAGFASGKWGRSSAGRTV